MSNRVHWESDFSVGHEFIDAQHRGLLTQCNLLADLGAGEEDEPDAERDQSFDQALDQLKALAREHFATEAELLAKAGYPNLENHQAECEEFEYQVGEVATTENFSRAELQRFLALWCLGHVTGSVESLRECFASGPAAV